MTIDELITHLVELKETYHLEDVEIVTPVQEEMRSISDPLPTHKHTGEMFINLKLMRKINELWTRSM